jgi:hypothetical protein
MIKNLPLLKMQDGFAQCLEEESALQNPLVDSAVSERLAKP